MSKPTAQVIMVSTPQELEQAEWITYHRRLAGAEPLRAYRQWDREALSFAAWWGMAFRQYARYVALGLELTAAYIMWLHATARRVAPTAAPVLVFLALVVTYLPLFLFMAWLAH